MQTMADMNQPILETKAAMVLASATAWWLLLAACCSAIFRMADAQIEANAGCLCQPDCRPQGCLQPCERRQWCAVGQKMDR